jgi:hypothetical protein
MEDFSFKTRTKKANKHTKKENKNHNEAKKKRVILEKKCAKKSKEKCISAKKKYVYEDKNNFTHQIIKNSDGTDCYDELNCEIYSYYEFNSFELYRIFYETF